MSNTTYAEYQAKAITTAIYPSQYRVTYPALALAGEVGEVAEKLNQGADAKEIGKELGGVLWYCAALAQDLDFNLEEVVWPGNPISSIQTALHGLAVVTGASEAFNDKSIAFLELSLASGKMANQVKKILRGDATLIEKKDLIVLWLRATVVSCMMLAESVGLDLGEIADQNIAVLASRQQRGTLKGDGDNR